MRKFGKTLWLWPWLLVAALSGCATSWTVDSNVASFARPPGPAAPATYRFERLPSQQAQEASQLELEAMAAMAMAGVGLTRDDAAPRYSVEITARVSVESSPWADPWFYGGWPPRYGYYGMGHGRAYGPYGHGWYGGYGGWWGPAYSAWYARDVSVVLRELPDKRVVYETRASNDGPYSATGPVFAALFQAAMQGYPNPPAGMRRVDVTLAAGQAPVPAPASAPPRATP